MRRTALDAPPTRDFAGALRREDGTLAVIAEIKRRSPSKGDLAPDLDAAITAKDYERGGASALSVLTDRPYFGGTVEDLQAAHTAVELPILRKDFTIDAVQVYETRAIGADAILLILAALPDDHVVRDLQELAWTLGLAVLVEAHSEVGARSGLALGARIVGVNAREPVDVRRASRHRRRRRVAHPARRDRSGRERDPQPGGRGPDGRGRLRRGARGRGVGPCRRTRRRSRRRCAHRPCNQRGGEQ